MSIITLIRRLFVAGKAVTGGLPEDAGQRDPIEFFGEWFAAAEGAGLLLPEAMTLATATVDGKPSARMVLLKGFAADGFVFYTNYGSQKAAELGVNPQAALVFHWASLQRQVRIEGRVERVSREESGAYFRSRPRGSRIGAWASRQSTVLASRSELEEREKHYRDKFKDQEIPLPEFWGGYRLKPERIEFWQGRLNRLHDRLNFVHRDGQWQAVKLFP